MVPVTQLKSRRNRLKEFPQSWSWLTRDRLGMFALAFVLALVMVGLFFLFLPGGLQGVGGIVFGTGLTVLISMWTNRYQLAKEANLRRKTEVYGPLHAELQTLRERLEEAQAGSQPYLQWIDVKGKQPPRALQLLNEEPLLLHCWPEFRADYRSLDFSDSTRQLLNKMLQLAIDYNTAVEQAREASKTILAPSIKTAITCVANSVDFHQWQQERKDKNAASFGSQPSVPHDWFVRIDLALSTPSPPATELVWATSWLETGAVNHQPATLGWLLSGNLERAVSSIYAVCTTPAGNYPPPPLAWLQAILDKAWPTLENDPTYRTARTLHEDLFKQVRQMETKLVDKLHYIQATYEGGPPPL